MIRILLCLLISVNCYSQSNFKKEIPSMIATYLSGALDGGAETLKWHYYEFERVFPNANQNYWNPQFSSQNKYKDGITANGPKYFGSTTFLVWTTDGYHLLRTGKNMMFLTAIILHPKEKKKLKVYIKDILVHSLIYQAGFHTTYGFIFRSRLY